ncbi:hypothetical protein FACUT_3250 [Fusarium acutatum]|uniref:Azaphilone pigments biosynthesis cluster protein L N-terminal domain-containing protein n=1 Tax=Fusarium acutatum TaxID=78861 RepID=A0A8H4JZF8_9HYPO|nr:hypothetical protein FACUT_3250 [Fusarium acutatum]
MAAEAVGLAASVITITDVAYKSSKRLYELIDGFRTASKTLSDLHTDLSSLKQLLKSLKDALGNTDDESLSDEMRKCLQNLKPSMEACHKVCDDFSAKVTQITSHSTEDHVSWRDKIRLQFEEKGIQAFQFRLTAHKATIDIVLGLVTLTSSDQNRQAQKNLETNIITAVSGISGRIEGLEISLRSLSAVHVAEHNRVVMEALHEHTVALEQCLRVCTSAVEAAPASTSDTVRRMEGYDSAKQLVAGDIGNAVMRSRPITVGTAFAHNQAQQALFQNVGADSIDGVMKFFQ